MRPELGWIINFAIVSHYILSSFYIVNDSYRLLVSGLTSVSDMNMLEHS